MGFLGYSGILLYFLVFRIVQRYILLFEFLKLMLRSVVVVVGTRYN